MKKLRVFLIIANLIACFIVYLLAVEPFTPAVQRVERLLNAPLPASAAEVKSDFMNGFQDDYFFLRLDLPSADFPAFIRQLCAEGEAALDTEYNIWADARHPDVDWWVTDDTPISVSAHCFTATLETEIFVDQTRPDVYRIFIFGGQL